MGREDQVTTAVCRLALDVDHQDVPDAVRDHLLEVAAPAAEERAEDR